MAVACLGELIVDLIAEKSDRALHQNEYFHMMVGGAPANVAIGLHHHGVPVRLISRVGEDSPGHFLVRYLEAKGISTRFIQRDPFHRTRIALVGRRSSGARYFEFHNLQSADQFLEVSPLLLEAIKGIRIFHFGGVAFLGETTALTTLHLLQQLPPATIITFDPNVRLSLSRNAEQQRLALQKALEYVHLLKCSEEDWNALFSLEEQRQMLADPTKIIIITRGAMPTELCIAGHCLQVPVERVPAIDTTGAGDAFMAALLAKLYRERKDSALKEVPIAEWKKWIAFAHSWGSRCVQFKGGVGCYDVQGE